MPTPFSWKLFIDTGGTFTDCLAIDPEGVEHREKILSNSSIRAEIENFLSPTEVRVSFHRSFPDNFFKGCKLSFLDDTNSSYSVKKSQRDGTLIVNRPLKLSENRSSIEIRSTEEAPVLAARIITGTPPDKEFPEIDLRLSTTKGTNALLERKGANTLFLITKGFKDLLNIQNQQRPDLFSLNIRKSKPFYSKIFEIPERTDANGNILTNIQLEEVLKQITPMLDGIESVGICLMNSTVNSYHEQKLKILLAEAGVEHITISSDLSKEIKIVPRAVTTDINSYLAPVMNRYLNGISTSIKNDRFQVMTSNGSLVEASHYKPKDGLLSGPAGGVTGAVSIAKEVSFTKIISFDMGGTSTDVARHNKRLEYVFEHSVGDAILASPAVDIETVAAGGGSICGFDGVSLTVGPESAGAHPGPACYGNGGPLTITDINLLSGRLDPSNFHISINKKEAEKRFDELLDRIHQTKSLPLSREQVLTGLLNIANERMAQAIQKISTQKGFDPSEYALVAFGGAGAQHACAIAQKLSVTNVIVPTDAGLLSAYGLQQSKLQKITAKQVLKPLHSVKNGIQSIIDTLVSEAEKELCKQGVQKKNIKTVRKVLFLRFSGQNHSLEVDWTEAESVAGQFKKIYKNQYGHWIHDREIELETIRVVVREKTQFSIKKTLLKTSRGKQTAKPKTGHFCTFIHQQKQIRCPVFKSRDLLPGTTLHGPVLLLEPFSTTVIEPGWKGSQLDNGSWLLTRSSRTENEPNKENKRNDAINLQLYTNRFRSAADQMGEMLQRTALSVNIKERLDFSCALLDSEGYLVVNAPHIPVHLGALGTCVRKVLQHMPIDKGDIVLTNHPKYGGSHLPDITVITPMYKKKQRIGFCVSRAHHAEIGGKQPGSMPPDAKTLAEEGVAIPPIYLAKNGIFNWNSVENILKNCPFPSRSPELNIADLRAAVAANHRGCKEVIKLTERYGVNEVVHYMEKLKSYAAARMRATLTEMDDGFYSAIEELDNGAKISVNCTVSGETMHIDFTGSSPEQPNNLNANPSIVTSVVMYFLRILVNIPLPLNDGLLEPVSLTIPKGILNPGFSENPAECPAVVGGNIETSQRLVDTLLKAFKLTAGSYGSMNNVLFGNNSFGYYETIGGGTGAGFGFDGASAVHQHMTNTRATDPEILENRYPVRLDRYEIRTGSGGFGTWRGGEGIIRELTFLEPVTLSVLTQHRSVPPYGLNGGLPGKTGLQWIERIDGKKTILSWKDGADIEKGDRFIIQTPGGGGYGKE